MTTSAPADQLVEMHSAHAARPISGERRFPLFVAVSLLLLLLAYSGTVAALVGQWSENLSHGYALAALTGWVLWRDRDELFSRATVWWPAVTGVVGAATLWLLGSLASIQTVEQVSFVILLGSWAVGVLGLANLNLLSRAVGYLSLSLPVWGLGVAILQAMTVAANSLLLAAAGLDATITGNFIALPVGTFEVAAGCGGLNYLISGITIGAAYGEVVPLSNRGRWLAIALMAGLSLVGNWIRVFILIVIGHVSRMQSPLMSDHEWFGWVIFAIAVAAFVWLSRFIEARHSHPRASDSPGSREFVAGVPPGRRALLSFTLMAAVGPLGAALIQQIPRAPSPTTIAEINGSSMWRALPVAEQKPLAYGDTLPAGAWSPHYFGADRHQLQRWARAQDTVSVDRLVFSGRDHRHKLFADGNAIASPRAVLLDRAVGINAGNRVRSMRQAVVRLNVSTNRALFYWFVVGGKSTGLPSVGRLQQVPAALLRRAPAELVVVSVPCSADCTRAFSVLQDFVLGRTDQPRTGTP